MKKTVKKAIHKKFSNRKMDDKLKDLYSHINDTNKNKSIKYKTDSLTRNLTRRVALSEWKNYYLTKYKFKCSLSGIKEDLEVHHLNIGYATIHKQALYNLRLDDHQLACAYSQEELLMLCREIKKLHRGVVGIVVHSALHAQFHTKYGHNASKYDWYEFKANFRKEFINPYEEINNEEEDY